MTLNEDVFNYIDVIGDEYYVKKDVSKLIKKQIKIFVEDFKKMYGKTIKIIF